MGPFLCLEPVSAWRRLGTDGTLVTREDGNRSCGPRPPAFRRRGYQTHRTGAVAFAPQSPRITRAGASTPPLREIVNLLNRFNLICPVQSRLQKYFRSGLTQIRCISKPSRPTEGRFAIVTDVGNGMRWTRERRARNGNRRAR